MRRPGFQQFIAVFFGLLLTLAAILAMITADEGMMLLTFAIAFFYAVYMVRFVRKERVQREINAPEKKSPLYRR